MDATFNPWRETFRVRSYDIGPRGKLTAQSLCRFLQEAAANHAEVLNVGGELLAQKELMWVLSRLHVRLRRVPEWREDITIETWPSHRTGGIRAQRDFRIYDAEKNIIGEAGSLWLLLAQQTRKPSRIPEFEKQVEPDDFPDNLLEDSEVPLIQQADYEKNFEVGVTHLDFNNHVNNACYLEYALNALPKDLFVKHDYSDLLFNFLGEGREGDIVASCAQEQYGQPSNERVFVHWLKAKRSPKLLAAIRTTWLK